MAYRYRLNPTTEQASQLAQWEGATRWLWNQFLAATTAQYAVDKKFLWGFELKRQIPQLKQQHDWLKLVPAHALQNVAFDLDKSLKRSTGKGRDQGFPKFKCKGRDAGTIKIDQVNGHIGVTDSHIKLPKIGSVKWRYHRPIAGILKQVSIIRDTGNWYVSVVCEIPDVDPIIDVDRSRTIGIDLGVSSFATLSDGTKIQSPNFLKQKLQKLKKYQRRLKNKAKGSSNRRRAAERVARIHRDIRNQRADWLHKLSHDLVNHYDVICVEDLKIKELLEKKQLSRSIADQGWGTFVNQLAYKCQLQGKHLTKINTYLPSTKTCSCCGATKAMKLSDRVYICENSQCTDYLKTKDRDYNAALNILFWGLGATSNIDIYTPGTGGIQACGDTIAQDSRAADWHFEVSAKQEAACPSGPQ